MMDNIFQETLPNMEITSIRLQIVVTKLFEKLRPLFKNSEEGNPSLSAIDMNNIFTRINMNMGYSILTLETLINTVEIPEKPKERRR